MNAGVAKVAEPAPPDGSAPPDGAPPDGAPSWRSSLPSADASGDGDGSSGYADSLQAPPESALPFNKLENRWCGHGDDCPPSNDLYIGAGDERSDVVSSRADAAWVCGAKCMLSADCGGFQYVDSMKRCYYSKDASCAQKVAADRDCYVKAQQSKSCEEWSVYPNQFARMFAIRGQFDLEGAKAKCTETQNCRAVTCNKHGKCTLRKGTLAASPAGETSYVPNTACQA